jgi:hypothetical protein
MSYKNNIDVNIEAVKLLFKEWEGFLAKVLYYNNSPGISGRLIVLLLSPQNKVFAIYCNSCQLLKTKFKWAINSLQIEYIERDNILSIKDIAGISLQTKSCIRFCELN